MNFTTTDNETAKYIDESSIPILPSSQYTWSADLIPTAIDTDGSVYNDTGYKTGVRINSAGNEVSASGWWTTGYIPITADDVWKIAPTGSNNTIAAPGYVAYYDSSFAAVNVFNYYTLPELMLKAAMLARGDPSPSWSNRIAYMRCTFNTATIQTIHKAT